MRGSSTDDEIRQLRIPGDLIIGGVFPVHAKGSLKSGQPCGEISETRGVHRVEAMLYALDRINEQSDFLRGYKLGALILDSCSNPSYALNQSLDFVRDLIGSTDASEFQCKDGNRPFARDGAKNSKVVAVVGGSYSSVTVQVANLLRLFRIVQVSPASTNADLSDKNRFEFFARTVPSDNYQARAMVDIAANFNWTYVSLVYSADEYGELGADAFKKEARRMNICIAIEERISTKNESLRESVENLIKKLQPDKEVGSRVVVLFVGTEYIPLLLEETARQLHLTHESQESKRIIWLASESWDRNNEAYTTGVRRLAAENALILMLESKRVPEFEEYYLSLRPGNPKFERNKWLRELWKKKFNCQFGLPKNSPHKRCEEQRESAESFNPDDKIQFVTEAVYAIAHALNEMKIQTCPNDTIETSWISRHSGLPDTCNQMKHFDGESFYKNYLLKVKFTDIANTKFHFTPEGDGPARYTILNYQPAKTSRQADRGDYVVVGKWAEDTLYVNESLLFWKMNEPPSKTPISRCSAPCQKGFKKQLIKADEVCCWTCSKCEHYEFIVNETQCVDCGEGRLPNKDRSGCYSIKDKNLQYMRWNTWYAFVPSIFSCIGILLTLFTLVVFIIHNDTPVVKASGRELSYILLAALTFVYLMPFVLLMKPGAFCVLFAMLVKTKNLRHVKSAKRPRLISPISQVFLTGVLAGVQLLGSFIWLIIQPPGTRYDYPTRDQVVLKCKLPDHHFLYSFGYDAALLVACTYFAIKTRKVPENFNETKFIGFSMYTTCILWGSFVMLFFGTPNNFQIQNTSLCISISMSANVVLALIFWPKLFTIIFKKHKNTNESSMRKYTMRSTYANSNAEPTNGSVNEPNVHTALLNDQRRRSRKYSQPTSSSTTTFAASAHDTFL
ncbi:G-PROTEIN-RECEP-F3-4 domain-containing protein [Aphelenchoides bicaudatus]|nr:G-PROTEIN-RECEP-F3-4 domain-containing protein [Aphelenchoides bicaudatus]